MLQTQTKPNSVKTMRGYIRKVVREYCIRNDVYCGAQICKVCESSEARLSSDASAIVIVDTNVVLTQIDLLESGAIRDVVILSVVMDEVQNLNRDVYIRLRKLCCYPEKGFYEFLNENHKETYIRTMPGEKSNSRNDRAIRVATKWYQEHLGSAVKVLLITNDLENQKLALKDGIVALTAEAYIKSLRL